MTNCFQQSQKSKVPGCLNDRYNLLEYYDSFLIDLLSINGRFYRIHVTKSHLIDRLICNTVGN